MIQFWNQLSPKFKEVNEANQDFYEERQCQKNNWIQKDGSCEPTLVPPFRITIVGGGGGGEIP